MACDKLMVHSNICEQVHDLYRRKNADYGDSFAKARQEIPCYTLGKLYDKFNRYLNLTRNREKTPQVDEALEDTLLDLANYAIMELTERQTERLEAEATARKAARGLAAKPERLNIT